MNALESLTASSLATSATLAALVSMLRRMGVLSASEEREIFEHALLILEHGQAEAPELAVIYGAARSLIEEQFG